MSIALTYHDDRSRVLISLSGLGGGVSSARVERSVNELLWEPVRGGLTLPVTSGSAALNDYEFAAGVPNFYRVFNADTGALLETGSTTPAFDDCEVWLKSIRHPMLNQEVEVFDYSDLERDGRTGVFPVAGRSFPVGSLDVNTSYALELTLRTKTAVAARKLHLTVALGGILFLQLAPDGHPQLPPRSFYFLTESSREQRVDLGPKRRLAMSIREMAPPAPVVTGSTLTWGTVRNLYGSWEQLRAANPSWGDLLALVGSPDDLVVI